MQKDAVGGPKREKPFQEPLLLSNSTLSEGEPPALSVSVSIEATSICGASHLFRRKETSGTVITVISAIVSTSQPTDWLSDDVTLAQSHNTNADGVRCFVRFLSYNSDFMRYFHVIHLPNFRIVGNFRNGTTGYHACRVPDRL